MGTSDRMLVLDSAGYVSAPMIATPFVKGCSTYTIECWVNSAQADQSGYIFRFANGTALSYGLYLHDGITNAAGPYVTIAFGNGTMSVTGNGLRLVPNTWTHVALTRGDSVWKLYKNGELVGRGKAWPVNGAFTTILGGGFKGKLMEFRIWNVERSQDSIHATMFSRLDQGDSSLLVRYAMNGLGGSDSLHLANTGGGGHRDSLTARLHGACQTAAIPATEQPLLDGTPPTVLLEHFPAHMQFFARRADDSVSIALTGRLLDNGTDSIEVELLRNDTIASKFKAVIIGHPTSLRANISLHAELSQYTLRLYASRSGVRWLVREAADLVVGDAYLITGQSNSHPSNAIVKEQSPFLRSFGVQTPNSNFAPYDLADTLWGLANGHGFGHELYGQYLTGVWGIHLQSKLMKDYHVPICIINGGAGASTIEQNLRKDSIPTSLSSIYGKTLYRSIKSGLSDKYKALFWYQGESNTISNYYKNFKSLYSGWKSDYPSVKKYYVFQVRPSWCGAGKTSALRELQRTLGDSLPNITVMSTASLPGHDGCHFSWRGYFSVTDAIYPFVTHDFYGGTDTLNVLPPQPLVAHYATAARDEILVAFKGGSYGLQIIGDTLSKDPLRDYLYLDDTTSSIRKVAIINDTLHIYLSSRSSATSLSYLPDQYFNRSQKTYEGPTIVNSRGVGSFTFYHFPVAEAKLPQRTTQSTPGTITGFSTWPSPFQTAFNIWFSLSARDHVSLMLYDARGGLVANVLDTDADAGPHTLWLDTASIPIARLSTGAYYLRLATSQEEQTLSLRVVR